MKKVLILGANGQIARIVWERLLKEENVELTLFLRNKRAIEKINNPKVKIIIGDATNENDLIEAINGQDIVYANLAGNLDEQAKKIVLAMDKEKVKRIIFVTALGIYNEVLGEFGKWNNQMIGQALKVYRRAADAIETSDLEYTVVRPAWLTNDNEINYETTSKKEPFKGTEVSRASVADYIISVIKNPSKDLYESVGVNKPKTDGDKPSFY